MTDLPDEVPICILGLLQGRSLRDIRHAYPLTSLQFYELFGRSLQVVDACSPTNEEYPPSRIPPHAAPFHLEQVLKLGGESVRLLSVPPYLGRTVEYI